MIVQAAKTILFAHRSFTNRSCPLTDPLPAHIVRMPRQLIRNLIASKDDLANQAKATHNAGGRFVEPQKRSPGDVNDEFRDAFPPPASEPRKHKPKHAQLSPPPMPPAIPPTGLGLPTAGASEVRPGISPSVARDFWKVRTSTVTLRVHLNSFSCSSQGCKE
jgi:hypothetical protein